MPTDLASLTEQYRRSAAGTGAATPDSANRCHDAMHEAYKQLRGTQSGRDAILALINDPSPHVRRWAASHSLAWAPQAARKALEELVRADGPCAFTARITLEEFDAGRLSFEY